MPSKEAFQKALNDLIEKLSSFYDSSVQNVTKQQWKDTDQSRNNQRFETLKQLKQIASKLNKPNQSIDDLLNETLKLLSLNKDVLLTVGDYGRVKGLGANFLINLFSISVNDIICKQNTSNIASENEKISSGASRTNKKDASDVIVTIVKSRLDSEKIFISDRDNILENIINKPPKKGFEDPFREKIKESIERVIPFDPTQIPQQPKKRLKPHPEDVDRKPIPRRGSGNVGYD